MMVADLGYGFTIVLGTMLALKFFIYLQQLRDFKIL